MGDSGIKRRAGMINAAISDGTVSNDIVPAPTLSQTQTAAKILTDDIGSTRSRAQILTDDVGGLHQQSHSIEWSTRTAARGKESITAALGSLADLGFAWRDIARLVGVSVPAIQKWRRGEGASGEKRRKVASLLAACDLIAEDYLVQDIASWFEMPLVTGVPLTPLDLYAGQQASLVFEYASGHADPEQILTAFDPEWRDRYRSDFEVFRAADGQMSIRPKDASR